MKKEIILFAVFAMVLVNCLGIVLAGSFDDKVDLKVITQLDKQDKVRVIVSLNEDSLIGHKNIKTFNNFAKTDSLNSISNITKITSKFNSFTALVSREELELIEQDASVEKINYDIPLKIFLQDSVGMVGASDSWNLQLSGINLTGAGRSVCILDTGINLSRAEFSERILVQKCYCSTSDLGAGGCCPDQTIEDESAIDDSGHGTHVAGIVGASGGINGIATGTGLVIVKIMNSSGAGVSSDLDYGLEWCVDNSEEYNISAITLSLGDPATKRSEYCDSLSPDTTSLINSAFAKNISVTIATGNNGWSDGITWPSCIQNATRVGAVNKDDNLMYNRNNLTKVLGIGIVNSTVLSGYSTYSGTSMATPMVAGAIAIINQYLHLNGISKNPLQVETALFNTGKIITEGANTFSRINVYDAIISLDNSAPNVILISPNSTSFEINQTFNCNASDLQLKNMSFYLWNSTGLVYSESKNISSGFYNFETNLTNLNFDNYHWNCLFFDLNNNSAYASSNFTLLISGISINLISPADLTYTNVNSTNFTCNSQSEDSYSLTNTTFYLWNSSGLIYNETKEITGFDNSSVFNYTFINESSYLWNCLSFNNNSNSSWGLSNFTISFDIAVPVFDLISETSITSSSATIYVNTNEETNISIDYGSQISNSTYSQNHSFLLEGLSASTSYNYNISSCDRAGNCNTTNSSFSTSAAPVVVSSSSSGGGGGGGSPMIVPQIFNPTIEQVSSGYSTELKKQDKVNFVIFDEKSENHTITVKSVTNLSVNLLVQSEPINITLGVGQSIKLNLTSPDYYDLYIKLDSVSNGKAKLIIQTIHDQIAVYNIVAYENKTNEENQNPENTQIVQGKDYLMYIALVFIGVIIFASVYLIEANKKIKIKKQLMKSLRKKKKI